MQCKVDAVGEFEQLRKITSEPLFFIFNVSQEESTHVCMKKKKEMRCDAMLIFF